MRVAAIRPEKYQNKYERQGNMCVVMYGVAMVIRIVIPAQPLAMAPMKPSSVRAIDNVSIRISQ